MDEQPGQGGSPQYSPDGKWWWDGQKWVPAAQAQPPVGPPPAGPTRPVRRRRRWPWVVGGLAVLLLIFIIAAVASGGGNSQKAANTATAAPTHVATQTPTAAPKSTSTAAPPAAPKVLLDLAGSGIKNSSEFNAPSHWRLHYTYDCSGFGSRGNFAVSVYVGSTPVDIAVNELGTKGDSTTDVYHAGQVHLEMNSECDWHVTAMTT